MKDNESLISVGIPFYNAERFLTHAIESVINQTYQNWELLLVDDGSTDSSLHIAKKFVEKDNRIKLFSDSKNKAIAARLNELSKLSSGNYIARMDADDIMHPQRLETQLQILTDNPSIDVLGANAYVIDENDLVFGMRYRQQSGLIKVEHFIHPTIMARKQWFLDNSYDEKAIRIEDAELWYRTKDYSNFVITNEPLLFYREFGGEYFKKYFAAQECKDYILTKYYNNAYWQRFFLGNLIKGNIYFLGSKLKLEQSFINKRSEVIFSNKKTIKELLDSV